MFIISVIALSSVCQCVILLLSKELRGASWNKRFWFPLGICSLLLLLYGTFFADTHEIDNYTFITKTHEVEMKQIDNLTMLQTEVSIIKCNKETYFLRNNDAFAMIDMLSGNVVKPISIKEVKLNKCTNKEIK